jgi:hypothetical protein
LGKIIFRCFCWWKLLESNARVDWTRQNLFWENVSRTRLRPSFSLPHHSPRPLPCLPPILYWHDVKGTRRKRRRRTNPLDRPSLQTRVNGMIGIY